MALLTEDDQPLLTEAGEELLAENETGSEPEGAITLRSRSALILRATASLQIDTIFTLLPLQSTATLVLNGQGALRPFKALKAQATLKLLARQLAANAIPGPSGLNALMKIITDPYHPALILDQYLWVWFQGRPSTCRVSLQIDDEPEFQPAWTWENPGVTIPAILKIDSAEIPGDGLTHRLTVRVWQDLAGKTSLPSTLRVYAKTPTPGRLDQPEWCSARLLRQGAEVLGDLTEVQWRHPGAVQIVARFKVLNTARTAWVFTEKPVGYADYDEQSFRVEDLGTLVWADAPGRLRDVFLGVAALHQGGFGPVQWAAETLQVKERQAGYSWAGSLPEVKPDAATARNVRLNTVATLYDTLNLEIRADVQATLSEWPANGNTIINTAISRLFRKIKDVIRQGGNVTLNDLGRFEARWNEERTTRSISFVASPGFKEGARQGRIITDAQAKALDS
jgi:hypothetical protein